MRLLGWGDLPLDDKAKKAIRENLALTAKAIYHYEMMLLIPDDERLTYLTDNLQVSFKSGQKVGYLIEYGNRCSQYNNYELEEGINAYDNDLEKTNSLPQMIDMMVASGKGWCLADPYSIAAEAGIVPQRYLDVAYVPDNADPEDKPLGWMDFLEAAEGNAAYAMMLVDRAEWTYPSTMADEDMRCNEVAKIDGKLMLTNGLPVEEADILAFDTVETVELSDKDMAMEAIKQEKDLYNVRTGLVLHPFVEYDTKNIAQVTSAFVPLSLLVGADGHVASEPWSYAVKHYIEPDGNTDGRIGWLPEFADVKVDDTHGIEPKSSTYAYLIKMMDKNGSGWCFGDTKSIAETAHSFKLDKELEIDAVMRSDQENRCIAHDDSKDDPGNR